MRRRHSGGRWLLAIVVLAVAALAVYFNWARKPPVNNAPTAAEQAAPIETALAKSNAGTNAPPPVPPDSGKSAENLRGATTRKADSLTASAVEVVAAYRRGMELIKANELVKARSELSWAYFSGKLPADRQDEVRSTLTELADITLIGRNSPIFPGETYAFHYKFRHGERLVQVERKLKLHVPWQIILRINTLKQAEDIQAGRPYKMIYGPFHAVIRKSAFTMDIYLHRGGLEKVFIRRMRVGTGADGSTPAGMWRVRLGGKQQRPTWYPPPNSKLRGAVPYGHPNYAFGARGLWIGLEGLDEHNRMLRHYGIHSTNDPNSIAQARSLGCIRLADEQIELVYSLLYEHWSTVEVRP